MASSRRWNSAIFPTRRRLGLDSLCWVWDNNHITIEGNTRITFTEDVTARFLAYGWNVLRVDDANDIERIEHAIALFQS